MKTEGWEQRLAGFIESRRGVQFAWGEHDCCAFTAGAVKATTGRDCMAYHRKYATALGAARVVRDAGGMLAIPEKHDLRRLERVQLAQRGDVVACSIEGRESLGVCAGESSFFASAIGTTTVRTADCVAAWRVE